MRKLLLKEHGQNQKGILTLTSLNGLLGSDKKERQNQKGILTWTGLNDHLGSDY